MLKLMDKKNIHVNQKSDYDMIYDDKFMLIFLLLSPIVIKYYQYSFHLG